MRFTVVDADRSPDPKDTARALVSLYALAAIAAVTLFAIYKGSARHLTPFSVFGVVAWMGLLSCTALLLSLVVRYRRRYRTLAIAAALCAMTLVTALGVAELMVRMFAWSDGSAVGVGDFTLRPTWTELVERSRRLVEPTSKSKATYVIFDPELGWVVGPNRESDDGLYASSVDGIRTARPGFELAKVWGAERIALIGDSNAFSLEVPFADSLGNQLAELLGDSAQVLNFGVNGYGIDQMYLRYARDVRPWKPSVVLIVFIQHDLARTMAVYPFISFGWSGLLVKPRFDIRDDRLEIINRPLPTPDEILNAVAPSQLPKIEYDPGDANEDWAWRFDRGPMLVRLVTSISPRWPDRKAQGNASIETLNVRLLEELIRMVERDNARPVVVLLPRWKGEDDIAKTVLAKIDHPYLDAKACLTAVPEQARRVPSGAHYSRQGNRAIALCALPFVRCALDHATCNYGCLRKECPQQGVQEGYRAPAKGRPDAENEPEPVSSNVPIRQEGKARP